MIIKVIRSVFMWTLGGFITIVLYFAMLFLSIVFPFDKQRRIVHAQCFWWSDAIITLNPYWEMHVKGLENIDKNRTYVIVANHQSLADIVVMYKTKMQFKWVAKESLFKVPFIGWSLSLAKHIQLSRGDFSSIKHVYRQAAVWLRSGMSVLFFPEGTRSETNDMRNFQNGAFKLAIKESVPVLPIYLEGTGNCIPKGSWLFETRSPCNITVLPAIETTGYASSDFARLRDDARAAMEKASS
jgi:1-acyl-sn-glycerol-3-phosphate acyltransferase